MAVLQLTAIQFVRPMATGRNRPLLLRCENDSGNLVEVVVKLRGKEMGARQQTAELVSAMLALDLGLDAPKPAVVEIPSGFEAVVPDAEAAIALTQSSGLNFGTVHLGTGFTTWPEGRVPHGRQKEQAAEIFAFDTLIQNPDRRIENPNVWSRSDRLGVYDHEQAFSFLILPIIGGAPRPWVVTEGNPESFRFLERHIFFASLRGQPVKLERFDERLGEVDDAVLQGYATAVPAEWEGSKEFCDKIVEYLREGRQERGKFVCFLKHLLR